MLLSAEQNEAVGRVRGRARAWVRISLAQKVTCEQRRQVREQAT